MCIFLNVYAQTVIILSHYQGLFHRKDHITNYITFYKQHVTYHLLRNGARASKSPSMNGNDRRRSEEILSLK